VDQIVATIDTLSTSWLVYNLGHQHLRRDSQIKKRRALPLAALCSPRKLRCEPRRNKRTNPRYT
jgi:hypothetical protein